MDRQEERHSAGADRPASVDARSSADGAAGGWLALLKPERLPTLAALVGGVLLHSMNVLLLATVLPSVVRDVGGAALMSWPTTAFLASSIVAASCAGLLTAGIGAGRAFCGGALLFCAGALLCAVAPSMDWVVAGRFVQGFGGGLLSALAYVLIRQTLPQVLWPRAFALIAGVWSVSVLLGPMLGGLFANAGDWRGAFLAVAALAAALAAAAPFVLPRARAAGPRPPVPFSRVALIALAIAIMSAAAVAQAPAAKAALIALAVAALAGMLRLDRAADAPLFASDAFSLHSPAGVGLWLALLLSISFTPLHIFAPLFLQRLHGFDPLAAGYGVAAASLAWTAVALVVAGWTGRWPGRLVIAGPLMIGAGLLGLASSLPAGPTAAALGAIALIGAGMGASWAFTAQGVMRSAKRGEEDVAASSVATVQQTGIALGAALAGLVANVAGLSLGLDPAGVVRAAFWVPASFATTAAAAAVMGLRLGALSRRAP